MAQQKHCEAETQNIQEPSMLEKSNIFIHEKRDLSHGLLTQINRAGKQVIRAEGMQQLINTFLLDHNDDAFLKSPLVTLLLYYVWEAKCFGEWIYFLAFQNQFETYYFRVSVMKVKFEEVSEFDYLDFSEQFAQEGEQFDFTCLSNID